VTARAVESRGGTVIILAGYELVRAEDRDTYVDAFRDLVSRAREFDGCVQIAITADSVDPERVNSLEVWRDAAALGKWRRRARAPRTRRPTYSDVQRYEATDGVPAF
jgi:quinol monooxygenase YgiN